MIKQQQEQLDGFLSVYEFFKPLIESDHMRKQKDETKKAQVLHGRLGISHALNTVLKSVQDIAK